MAYGEVSYHKTVDGRTIQPAGAPLPPEEPGDVAEEQAAEEVPAEPAPEPAPEQAPPAEPRLYAGKYKTPEELEAGHQELQALLGRQSNELGDTRKMADALAQQNAALMASRPAEPQPPTIDEQKDAALADIASRVESGEISTAESLKLTALVAAEYAAKSAEMAVTRRFEAIRTQEEAGKMVKSFNERYPDFEELRKSGALRQATLQDPILHDDVTAYFALKALEAQEKARQNTEQVAQAAYQKGNQDATQLAKGVEVTRTVIAKPGATVRQVNTPKKPMGPNDFIASMVEAMKQSNA